MSDPKPDLMDTATPARGAPRITEATMTPSRIWRRHRYWIITVLNIGVFFLFWEWFARMEFINAIFLPKFSDVLTALRVGWLGGSADTTAGVGDLLKDYVILHNFFVTLRLFAIGMVISVVLGIPIGLMMGGSKWADALLSPYVWTLSSLPRIALFPILVLFLGLGTSLKIALVISAAIFPIIINAWAGVKTTERGLLNAVKVFGASRIQTYRKVVLPYTVPFLVSGIQQGLSRGLVGVILAEFLASASVNGGLGWLIFRSGQTFNAALTYASLLSLAVLALALVQGTRSLEARIAPWRQVSEI